MTDPQPPPDLPQSDAADEALRVPTSPSELDQARRTSMAAERTWLAWWRTALGATAGALAVGRFAPDLLNVAPWPYILLGCGYASLAVGLLIVGAQRQRELEHALRTGGHVPLQFRTVGLFTVGGVALAIFECRARDHTVVTVNFSQWFESVPSAPKDDHRALKGVHWGRLLSGRRMHIESRSGAGSGRTESSPRV